ncbi:MAG: hypothetical protein ACM3X4_06375 [Ignavibacteriales bacterium]
MNLRDGTFSCHRQNAYGLSGNGKGAVAFATCEGVGIADRESIRTIVTAAELCRTIGFVPGYSEVPGPPEEYLKAGPEAMARWFGSYVPIVERMAWSPSGDSIALLVNARSFVSMTVIRSAALVLSVSEPRVCRVVFRQEALQGKIRTVAWLDKNDLLIIHSDYQEPEDELPWADNPPDPLPTVSFAAADVADYGRDLIVRLPWHARTTAFGRGLVAVFHWPKGAGVDPDEGAIIRLREGQVAARTPEGMCAVTVPDEKDRYFAVRVVSRAAEPGEVDLVGVCASSIQRVTSINAGVLSTESAGHWSFGLCPSHDGRQVAEVAGETVRVFGWRE